MTVTQFHSGRDNISMYDNKEHKDMVPRSKQEEVAFEYYKESAKNDWRMK